MGADIGHKIVLAAVGKCEIDIDFGPVSGLGMFVEFATTGTA